MSSRVRRLFVVASFLLAVPLAGCKQGIGDRCQLDSDCSSGRCVLPTGGSQQQGGTCRDTNSPATDDASAGNDLSASVDLASSADLATASEDLAGEEDLAGGADAGTDASPTDGSSQD